MGRIRQIGVAFAWRNLGTIEAMGVTRNHREPRTWGTIRTQKSGNFTASYRHLGVEYHCWHVFSTKTAAQNWLADELTKIEAHTWKPFDQREDVPKPPPPPPPPPLPTLDQFAADWLARAPLRDGTIEHYDRQLRKRILPAFGQMHLDEITRAEVRTWWRAMTKDGERRCHHHSYGLLHTIMEIAIADELITEQPCRIKGAGTGSEERSITPLTAAQIAKVANAFEAEHTGWGIAVMIAGWCALRSGEVRELRRKDVDIDKRAIHIRRAVTRVGSKLNVGPPKTKAGLRDAPIPEALIPLIEQHLEKIGPSPDALLIANEEGENVDDRKWDRTFKMACRKALGKPKERQPGQTGRLGAPEDPGYWFHDLRRTALTNLAVAGATIKELQHVAGHTTPNMAMRYQEVAQSHLDEVVDRMSIIMSQAA